MASYLDEIPKFREYVPQLPVQAMAQVGMYKQQKYEENVTKIQKQIDDVAGLDIYKDTDRAYLQSKLDELGSNLRTFAAGDFSNFQLVNSVSGMTKQIAKDSTVQTAVASTAKLRKEQAVLEDLRKRGKSSANREFDFYNSINEWANDGKVGSAFNGQMKEHIDVNKKVLDVIQKLHPNVNVQDHPYVINKDGSVNYGMYAAIMQRQGIKGVDEGQIKTAVNAVLDSSDYDELASQGRYNYKDYKEVELQNFATKSYDITKKDYEKKLDKLQKQLLVTTDISKQLEINSSIDYYKSMLGDGKVPGQLTESYKSTLESIRTNPNEARAKLYTRNWLDQIANGFSYKEVSDEVLANPGRAEFWKGKEYDFNVLKEQHDVYFQNENLKIAKGNLAIAQSKEAREAAKTAKELGGGAYYVGSGDPTTDNLEAAANWSNHMATLSSENTGILDQVVNMTKTFDKAATHEQILSNIEKYKSNQYTPASVDEKMLFDKYIQNSNSIATQQKLHDDLEAKAYEKIAGAKTEREAIYKELSKKGGLVTTLPSGQKITFSPKEVFDYLAKEYSYTDSEGVTTLNINEAELNDQEKKIRKALDKRYSTYGGSVNPTVDAYIKGFSPLTVRNKSLKNMVATQVANDLAGLTGSFKTEQAAVTFKDGNEKNRFIGELTNIAGANLNMKVAGQNYTPKDLIESLKNKNADDIEVQTVRKGNKYFIKVLDKKNPGDSQMMPVDESFVALNSSLGESYLNKGLDLAEQTLRNGGSTNGYDDYDHAYYHNGMFGDYTLDGKKTVTVPVVADMRRGSDGQFYATFKLKTGTDFIKLPYYQPVDYSTFPQYLKSLNNDKILKLFKTKYPNIEQLISQ